MPFDYLDDWAEEIIAIAAPGRLHHNTISVATTRRNNVLLSFRPHQRRF